MLRGARRREMRLAQRDRVQALAATVEPPTEPLVWRSGTTARIAAVLWCVTFAALTVPPVGGSLAAPDIGGLVFAVWTSLVAGWAACRVALWRVTADRDGVRVRRLWSTTFLSWSVISHVEARRDGLLEFVGPPGEPMGGLFRPPWLSRRLGLPDTLGEVADTLTAMALHPRLRAPAEADRALSGTPFARWAIPLGLLLCLARDLVHR
ncbi:hypothetical protein [Streptomyces bambusae]|uniref:PH domain-containing protein n=1 Tax=Streptomyces bambusae TaxID=1550616 RepID=A0ABS6YYB3_9ACTN|nr:hypothetical protein [Streptomyces bambusae]MBW5480361.1 hypothetical protein [Streptomyces bambusae]